jgi:hypothetical protein
LASNQGTDLVWCEEEVEMLGRDVNGGIFELRHVCGSGEDHDGSHRCMFCPAEWDMEVPC